MTGEIAPDCLAGLVARCGGGLDFPSVAADDGHVGDEGGPRVHPRQHTHQREDDGPRGIRSEEHTSELQSLMRISYAVFLLKKITPQSRHATMRFQLPAPTSTSHSTHFRQHT